MAVENNSKRTRVIAAIAVFLLISTGVFLAVQIRNNGRMSEALSTEKLSAESLLSQKLALDKEVLKLREDLKLNQSKSSDLDRLLSENTRKLEAAERDLKNVQRQGLTVSRLKEQNKELQRQKEEIDQQILRDKSELDHLKRTNEDLEKTVALLQRQNSDLTEELSAMRLSSLNEILIESTTKSSKLTVKAKRAKNLIVNVDVPSQAEDLSFKIVNPAGKELTDKEGTFRVNTISKDKKRPQAFYVPGGTSAPQLSYDRVQMTYQPKEKLSAGIYNIEILSSLKSIGSLQVKLR